MMHHGRMRRIAADATKMTVESVLATVLITTATPVILRLTTQVVIKKPDRV